LHFLAHGGAQFVAGFLHLGTILLANLSDLGKLVLGQIEVLQVCDPMGAGAPARCRVRGVSLLAVE
jgi:hypothetical protein